MTSSELIGRLTEIIVEQAEIIEIQSDALAQLGAVEGLDARVQSIKTKRVEVIGI